MTDPRETGRTELVRELASELNELTEKPTQIQSLAVPPAPEPTTSETVLAAFPELRDTDYGRYLDKLDRDAERGLAQFRADMARLEKEAEK